MRRILRLLLLGLMTWFIPFFVAFFFIDKTGQHTIDTYLFKTIMIIVGGIVGAFAIGLYFKKFESSYLKQGLLSGFVWMIINIILDFLTLVPMANMAFSDYFNQIGLRYLMIPIMCILVGYMLETKIKNRNFKTA